MAMAMALFNRGRITSGQAAMMAGCERVDFLTQTAASNSAMAMPLPEDIASDAAHLQRVD